MKIAVIGSGGREHAIVKRLMQSPGCTEVVAIPGNGGMGREVPCVPLKATELSSIVSYCCKNSIEYVVVAPDDPLALGLVDMLAEVGIPAFGPTAAAAQIEASKSFAKRLMQKYNIPTAGFAVFDDCDTALAYLGENTTWPVVVKADGLALGKGVAICPTWQEAREAVEDMMLSGKFGKSGARVVVEEFLTGPEVSVLTFCDGGRLAPMVSSMDHKRIFDGDRGPNTGGMGTVAPNPAYTPEMARRCMAEIFLPTVRAMAAEGAPFKGCLYFGLMLTETGPKVIEYNCRFGDPETQVTLPLLEGDLLEVMLACTAGRLTPDMVKISPGAAACVVLASGGYPGSAQTGLEITGLEEAAKVPGVQLYHAGTRLENGKIFTAGGRVLGVAATGQDLPAALQSAYKAAALISFEGMQLRADIGRRALEFI